jgi:glutamate--cysteine ligase
LTHPYLTTDFSEALLEFVTPPYPTNWEALQFLCDMHCFTVQNLGDELLWAQSMPCVMPASGDIPIADYGTSNLGRMKTVYRRGLGYRYGRAMQAISGVHFNFSLPSGFWEAYRDHRASSDDLRQFKSGQYMALVRNYRRHAWMLIYLFGASPALCKSFDAEGHAVLKELDSSTWYAPFGTSLRMSDIGYRNKSQAGLQISANSLDDYVRGLVAAVTTPSPQYEKIGVRVDGCYRQLNANVLQIENEYYTSIRPKPDSNAVDRPTIALRTGGVEYVEVRTLDVNALDPVGVNQNQLRFVETLLLYCLLCDSPPIDSAEQAEIDARDLLVAREGRRPGLELPRGGKAASMLDWALETLAALEAIAAILDVDGEDYVAAVDTQRAAILDPTRTPAAQLITEMQEARASFLEFTLALSRAHCEYFASLRLEPAKEGLLRDVATQSLQAAQRMETDSERPLDEYLAEYFAQV